MAAPAPPPPVGPLRWLPAAGAARGGRRECGSGGCAGCSSPTRRGSGIGTGPTSGSWRGPRRPAPASRPAPSPPRRRSAMRVALYARVSTRRQAQADGIAQQLDRLRAHALGQGWTVAEEDVFRDDGRSGASLRRAGGIVTGTGKDVDGPRKLDRCRPSRTPATGSRRSSSSTRSGSHEGLRGQRRISGPPSRSDP